MRSASIILISIVFLLNIGDTVAVFYTGYRGFVTYPRGPNVYFSLFNIKEVDNGWYAVEDFCLSIAGYCADLLMCYRTSSDRRVLYLPVLLFPLGAVGCVTLVVFDAIAAKSGAQPGFPIQYYAISVTLFSLTIAMTWYYTGLICFRLWLMERQKRVANAANLMGSAGTSSNGASGRLYRHVLRVLIQSGLLYSLTQLSFLICFIADNKSGQIVIGYLNIRIIGIVTALIMLQLHAFDDGSNLSHHNCPHEQRQQTFTTHSIPVFRAIGTSGTIGTRTTDTRPEVLDDDNAAAKEASSNASATGQLRFLQSNGNILARKPTLKLIV
ncbi:hypothetical protein FRB96_005529 [Tulasnella sp. 330]|nr:hypothetical protein FRB96_005529 [Tulasnella sp. 330]